MTDFEKWKEKYNKNWVTEEQLKRLVTLSVLTSSEYEEITGEVYSV